jgi:hypothetical protein
VTSLDVQTLPDAEQELAALLRAQLELGPVADRVYTAFPAKAGNEPLLVVHRFGGSPIVGRPLVLDEALIQIDVYGGSKGDVARLGSLVRALLADRADQAVLGPYRVVPDETFTPPRPRALIDVSYYLRPTTSSAAASSTSSSSSAGARRRDPDPPPGEEH